MTKPDRRLIIDPLWIDLTRLGSAWDEQLDAHAPPGVDRTESYRHRERRHAGQPEAEWREGPAPAEQIQPKAREVVEPPPPRPACLTIIGHLPLITPRPVYQLHPATQARVLEVEALLYGSEDRLPDPGGACRLILAIERDLGITTGDRLAAVNAQEPWEAELEAALALAAATANGKALAPKTAVKIVPAELPARERGRSPEDEERWDKARADLLNPNLPLRDGQKDSRARIMAQVENAPAAEEEKAWREESLAETVSLAEARGDEITTTKGGAKLIITNDGLWNLHERRKLTIEQYEEGQLYRRDREMRSQDLGSQLGGEGGGSSHNNDRFVANRLKRAKASAMVALIDRAVAGRCITHPTALDMLRWVAGDGRSIAVWGKGRQLDRNVGALCAALDVAMSVRTAEEKRRRDEEKAWRESETPS